MYDIFALYFSEETIHPKVSICGHQGTDDETGLIALPLMVHIKTADLVVGKESSHCALCRPLVGVGRLILND